MVLGREHLAPRKHATGPVRASASLAVGTWTRTRKSAVLGLSLAEEVL